MGRIRVLVAALAVSPLALATPAQACSCSPPDVDASLAVGGALALVTRVDDGLSSVATLAVERAIGVGGTDLGMPEHVQGEMDHSGGSCQPFVPAGGVAALVFERRAAVWHVGSCGEVEFGPALKRILGTPTPAAGGVPVALAAGTFGGSRLAALDAAGNAVAWADADGSGSSVAACPGGRRVVAAGRTDAPLVEDRRFELTRHATSTLRTLSTVPLPLHGYGHVLALRCADPDGERVEVLVSEPVEGSAKRTARLLIVERSRVRAVPVGEEMSGAEPVPGGFIATEGLRGPRLVRITPEGRTSVLARFPRLWAVEFLAVSRDGRSVAVAMGSRLITVDGRTGRVLGWRTVPKTWIYGLAWTSATRLVVRADREYRDPAPLLTLLDRRARARPELASAPGSGLAAVGGTAVSFGHAADPCPAGTTRSADPATGRGRAHRRSTGTRVHAMSGRGLGIARRRPSSSVRTRTAVGMQSRRSARTALATFGAALGVAVMTSGNVCAVPTPDTPPLTRLVSVGHIAVAVPLTWGTNVQRCGAPQEDTVFIDHIGWNLCAAGPRQNVESVELVRGGPRGTPDRTLTVDGVEAQRYDGGCEATRWRTDCAATVYFPAHDIGVEAFFLHRRGRTRESARRDPCAARAGRRTRLPWPDVPRAGGPRGHVRQEARGTGPQRPDPPRPGIPRPLRADPQGRAVPRHDAGAWEHGHRRGRREPAHPPGRPARTRPERQRRIPRLLGPVAHPHRAARRGRAVRTL